MYFGEQMLKFQHVCTSLWAWNCDEKFCFRTFKMKLTLQEKIFNCLFEETYFYMSSCLA